jgi:Protein-tyrosine-phosphatase-like, N-terminal domain
MAMTMTPVLVNQELAIRGTSSALINEFAGRIDQPTVEQVVRETVAKLREGATVQLYIPLLAQRVARARLRELAAQGHVSAAGVSPAA